MNCENTSIDISHSGIKGMHWGQRRFQNEDGSLTPAGRERYGVDQSSKPTRAENARMKAKVKKAASAAKKVGSKVINDDYKDYVRRSNKGKLLLQSVLMGPVGAMSYQQARAHGRGRLSSLVFADAANNAAHHPIATTKRVGKVGYRAAKTTAGISTRLIRRAVGKH